MRWNLAMENVSDVSYDETGLWISMKARQHDIKRDFLIYSIDYLIFFYWNGNC